MRGYFNKMTSRRGCIYAYGSTSTSTSSPDYLVSSHEFTIKTFNPHLKTHNQLFKFSTTVVMATPSVQEVLPTPLNSTSEQPPLFDGTTRLYTCYKCPYAQRVWIIRNYKGLQDKIKLVGLDLPNRPDWYKEKVYPANKVPSLDHNGKIIGESLDLIKYVNSNFEGPALLPEDAAKQKFAEELLSHTDAFTKVVYASLIKADEPVKEVGPNFDYIETALHKFDDGPFFLGQFSLVDIAYVPFIERFHVFLQDVWKYDITAGRPKLATWVEEMNKIDAYKQTKTDPKELVESYNKLFPVLRAQQ